MDEPPIEIVKIRRRISIKGGLGPIATMTALCHPCKLRFEAKPGAAGDPGRFADLVGAVRIVCPSCGTEATFEHSQLESL
jgi:hypothetical protein